MLQDITWVSIAKQQTSDTISFCYRSVVRIFANQIVSSVFD